MKRLVVVALTSLLALLTASPAFAVIADRVLGLDIVGHVPVGDLANGTGMGFGGLVRYEQKLQPTMALTGRAGWVRGSEKEVNLGIAKVSYGLDFIPVYAGLVYRTTGTPDGLFLSAEVGANFLTAHATGGTTDSAYKTKLGANVGVGLRADALSFRGGLNILDLSNVDTSMGLMVSVGWDFKRL